MLLVDHHRWSIASAAADPFAAHRKGRQLCGAEQFEYDLIAGHESVEVQTGECNYLTIEQPLAAAVKTGDILSVRVWHFFLDIREMATAEVAIQLGAAPLWSQTIALPADSRLYSAKVTVATPAAAGSPVYFHIRNHGRNSWHLLDMIKQ